MFNRIKAISKKEFKQLLRDKRFLLVIIFFPLFLLIIFGYAVNFDVKDIKISILDNSKSSHSRELISRLTSSDYFNTVSYLNNEAEIKQILDRKAAQAVVVFPQEFSKKIERGKETAKVQFLLDGVDGNAATIIKNYLTLAVMQFNRDLQEDALGKYGISLQAPIVYEPVFWFNPDLQTTRFLIPGLIVMILIIISVISVSLSLVKEKEFSTIEQINVSAIKPFELLIGKSLPYITLSFIDAILILIAGYLFFDVVVKGSFLLLFFMTLIFIISSTSMGIFISVISDTQQIAFMLSSFATLLPSVILSDFIFPIESMPKIIQIITNITPAKFFITILRSIIIKGVGISVFWDQVIYLLIFLFVFLTLAIVFRKRKELSA